MKAKTLIVFLVLMISMTALVSAVNLNIKYVKINGEEVPIAIGHTDNLKVERGEELEIKVCVQALDDVEDAQIEADIYGYRYSNREGEKVSDTTPTFDLDENDTECHELMVEIPTKMEVDYYKLRIRAGDRDGTAFEKMYQLNVKGVARESAVEIKDFTIDPTQIIAGRSITSMVKVRNIGDDDLEDLKITLSIPELNIKTSEYMDELEADDSKTFEELLLRIPECTKPGTYDVVMTVEFDEYEETESQTTIKISGSETCGLNNNNNGNGNGGSTQETKTVITVPNYQEITQGTSVIYPVMINNKGIYSRTYTITVSGLSDWASTRMDPSSVVVVPAGTSKTVYLYVSANKNAQSGDKAFTLNVESSDGESKQTTITAKVAGSSGSQNNDLMKKGLEIGLVILVIVLIIIGLIIGFNKLKENKEEPETYY